jgi:hypothetical protein
MVPDRGERHGGKKRLAADRNEATLINQILHFHNTRPCALKGQKHNVFEMSNLGLTFLNLGRKSTKLAN